MAKSIGICPQCLGHCESIFAARLESGHLACPVCEQVLTFMDDEAHGPAFVPEPSPTLERITALESEVARLKGELTEARDEIEQHNLWREEAYRQLAELRAALDAARKQEANA